MKSAELDFYAPGKDQKKQNQDRLQRQRDDMYAWRGKKVEEAPERISDGPKQHMPEGSQRAAAKQAEEKRKDGAVWDSAAVHQPDRRREWRNTGLTFDREHFRTSQNPDSKYHSTKKGTITDGAQGETYEPYFHDTITIHKPPAATTGDNTLLMVSYNSKDAKERELQASRSRNTDRARGNNSNLCDVLGPEIASKQRAAELAEAVYSDMVMQQSVKTGTAYGSTESRHHGGPTSEVAYCVREGYENRHRVGPHAQQGTRGATASDHRSPTSVKSPEVVSRTLVEREEEEGQQQQQQQQPQEPADPFKLNSTVPPDGTVAPRQPAEVKSVRVYTVAGHTGTSNRDTSMVRRKSPPRQGEPVVVPDSWLQSNNSSKR